MKAPFNLAACMCFTICCLQAQVRVEALTVADGLSQGYVTSIIQDYRGFMWLGTFDGLNRYDGYTVRQFKPKPFDSLSIQTSFITSLYEGKNNIIWVGTTEGLYLFDPWKEKFFDFGEMDAVFDGGNIAQITGDKFNNIFIEVYLNLSPSRLIKLSPSADITRVLAENKNPIPAYHFQELTSKTPFTQNAMLLPCIGDTMILVNNKQNQVLRYNYQENQFAEFKLSTLPAGNTVDHSILWGNNYGFVFRWKLPDGRDSILPVDYWPYALKLHDGHIGAWMYPPGMLIEMLTDQPVSGELVRTGQRHDHPGLDLTKYRVLFNEANQPIATSFAYNKIMADRNGLVWIGTGGMGVKKINPRHAVFGSLLTGKSVSSIRELPNNLIWARFYSDASCIINAQTGRIEPKPWKNTWNERGLYEVYFSKDNKYWSVEPSPQVGLDQNVLRNFDPETGASFRFAENLPFLSGVPEKVIEDREGNIWVSGHKCQLFRCRPGQKTLERITFAHLFPVHVHENIRVTTIVQDDYGDLWLGTNQGIVHIENHHSDIPQFSLLKHDDNNLKSLSIDWVTCILPDVNDRDILWIGTRGGGLNRMHIPSQTFNFWTEGPNELPNNVVYGILSDDLGSIWCSTNRGLFRFSPGENRFTAYQEADGLSSTEFNTNSFMRTRDGRLWFGGVNGLNFFKPEDIQLKNSPPQVAITSIYVLGKRLNLEGRSFLSLPYTDNNVLFEFAALDFANPATNRFRHRLKGIDRDWVYDGVAHSVNYSALPSGRYVFELQGATADSPWNENSVVFILEIRTPWYRSLLAYIFYALLGAAAIYGYSRYRVQVFSLRSKARLNQLESERLKAFEAIKNEFFANVAHELRTPLTVILGLANRIFRGEKGDSIQDNAQQIIRQGDQLLQLTNQVLDIAKLESNQFQLQRQKGNIIDFIQQHVANLRALANSKGIQLHTRLEPIELWTEYDQQQLQKILNNLISNAVRHTPPNGTITITVQNEKAGEWLSIAIADNGEGIAAKDLPHVFDRFFQSGSTHGAVGASGIGLALTRDLVELMGGRISVESHQGEGTTFTIFLPVKALDAPVIVHQHSEFSKKHVQIAKADTNELPLLLVIEDNPDVSAYLRLCLQPHFNLKMADNGVSGIHMAFELMPDIILTDVAMPLKNGYEVTETLKNDLRSSHIPIVMLTAKVEYSDRLEGQRRGANAYLTKPFDESELLVILNNLLHLQRQWKARYKGFLSGEGALEATEHRSTDQQVEDAFILQMQALFEANYTDDGFNLDRLCLLLNMSSSQLDRKLKVLTDQSPMQMLRSFRLQKARAILHAERHISIKELCFRTGFKNPSHFSRLYSKEFGVPPSEV